MLHLFILLLCHLSYIQLGKLDSTIPHPKPHLTLPCFIKLLSYIPFNIGLQLSYFQNVTKLIRDVLILFYIVGQYYSFEYHLIFRLLGFDFFSIFVLPLILEGWVAHNPNYVLYLVNFYSVYTPLFINQFLIHDNRVVQTIFFLALIEIPSMIYSRFDPEQREIKMNSYIFKLVQLPQNRIAILHCAKKNLGGESQIELAIAQIKKCGNEYEWVVSKRVNVNSNTSELNFVSKTNVIVISSCSELRIFDAISLKLLQIHHQPRKYKRLSFAPEDELVVTLKKHDNDQSLISVFDVFFGIPIVQQIIPLDMQPEFTKFIKYQSKVEQDAFKYIYVCVPSDRQHCIMIVDIGSLPEEPCSREQSPNANPQSHLAMKMKAQKQKLLLLDQELEQLQMLETEINIKEKMNEEQKYQEKEEDDSFNKTNSNQTKKKIQKTAFDIFDCEDDINLYEHLKYRSVEQSSQQPIKEYIVDDSAVKDILVYQQLLVVSCSERILFFDLRLRRIVKRISTLSFDTKLHWMRVNKNHTYYLVSNDTKAWMIKQNNNNQKMEIDQHYNFYGIQQIIENHSQRSLSVIYNNALFKQKIALISLPE